MPIIVEDGSLVDGANSYVSLEKCNEYHATLGNETWTGTDAAKTAAIFRAMAYIEALPWCGYKITYEQPLQWPRADVVLDGHSVPTDEVPNGVISALCESALLELVEPGVMRPSLDRGGQVTSFSLVGVVSETYASNAPAGTVHQSVVGPLRGLLRGSGMIRVELA